MVVLRLLLLLPKTRQTNTATLYTVEHTQTVETE